MNIQNLLETGANVSVVVSVADLKEFAMSVFAEAMAALHIPEHTRSISDGEFSRKIG